jgi:hypothetical protein
MNITTGPNKGYYYLPTPFLNDNSIVRDSTVYSRMKLPPGQRIHGFNKSYLPYIDGYYYVPKSNVLDVRKVIYALQTQQVPSSGNTETFLRDFQYTTTVPADYCPYYLDPCDYTWCKKCKNKNENTTIVEKPKQQNIYMLVCFFILTLIIVLSIRS